MKKAALKHSTAAFGGERQKENIAEYSIVLHRIIKIREFLQSVSMYN